MNAEIPAVQPFNQLPLYLQVQKHLEQLLVAGRWKGGDCIDSEKTLAELFNVSLGTVRKAIDNLVQEGIIVRRQGKGNFVISHHDLSVQKKFLPFYPDDSVFKSMHSTLVNFEEVPANVRKAKAFGIEVFEPLYRITRVHWDRGVGYLLDEVWLPKRFFPDLDASLLVNTKSNTDYEVYEDRFGVTVIRTDNTVKACHLTMAECTAMGRPMGECGLHLQVNAFTFGNQMVEQRFIKCCTSHHSLMF